MPRKVPPCSLIQNPRETSAWLLALDSPMEEKEKGNGLSCFLPCPAPPWLKLTSQGCRPPASLRYISPSPLPPYKKPDPRRHADGAVSSQSGRGRRPLATSWEASVGRTCSPARNLLANWGLRHGKRLKALDERCGGRARRSVRCTGLL